MKASLRPTYYFKTLQSAVKILNCIFFFFLSTEKRYDQDFDPFFFLGFFYSEVLNFREFYEDGEGLEKCLQDVK